jgi:hypothetical protein
MKMMSMVGGLNPMRKRNIGIVAAFLGLMVATPSMAASDSNVTVTSVGSQGGTAYIQTSTTASNGCPFQTIYIDVSTESGRAMFAIALTARASSRPIARIDYTGGGSATCVATLIQL